MTESTLLDLVRRAEDSADYFDEIEGARDHVRGSMLPVLASAYGDLDWMQRQALIYLMQDHDDDVLRPTMHDFLVHSPEGGESFHVARAIALCHLERTQDDDAFSGYLENRAAVEQQRAHWRNASAES